MQVNVILHSFHIVVSLHSVKLNLQLSQYVNKLKIVISFP